MRYLLTHICPTFLSSIKNSTYLETTFAYNGNYYYYYYYYKCQDLSDAITTVAGALYKVVFVLQFRSRAYTHTRILYYI